MTPKKMCVGMHAPLIMTTTNCVVVGNTGCYYTQQALQALPGARAVMLDTMGAQGQQMRQQLAQQYKHTTVPFVFIGGKFIGGFTELQANAHGDREAIMNPNGVRVHDRNAVVHQQAQRSQTVEVAQRSHNGRCCRR